VTSSAVVVRMAPTTERRSKRRSIVVAAIALAVIAVAFGTYAFTFGSDDSENQNEIAPATSVALESAAIERRDLVETVEVDGTLGFGERTTLKLPAATESVGTITDLPAEGSIVERGASLVEIDGLPSAVVMYGKRPMWRTLNADAEDGPDVRQLEKNLVALGFATTDELTVDQEFTSTTAEIVEDWQASLGRDETGEVEPGDVVFLPEAVRVAEQLLAPGDAASGEVLAVTDTTRRVHVDLDAADADLVTEGATVTVELTDGTEVEGTVTAIGTVADVATDTEGGTTTTTIDVDITITGRVQALDESPVTVDLVSRAAEGVLAAPVSSLLALAGGGYAVQVVRGGQVELVAVTTGMFTEGWVEVTGDIAEGDQVVAA
jgi:Putative peptidoglycan binding domain